MRRMVLWDTACNFNAFISNQSIFICLITGASTLLFYYLLLTFYDTVQSVLCYLIQTYKTCKECRGNLISFRTNYSVPIPICKSKHVMIF